jgi:hypothetical protein
MPGAAIVENKNSDRKSLPAHSIRETRNKERGTEILSILRDGRLKNTEQVESGLKPIAPGISRQCAADLHSKVRKKSGVFFIWKAEKIERLEYLF